jgi:NAD(P)-dependent dehydrogenase (short-subunit alcohol dehydrogenase family)
MNRRNFLLSAAGVAALALTKSSLAGTAGTTAMMHKERVDRTLRGQDVDRPPFTFYLRARLPIRRVVGPADVAALAVHIMINTALTGATYDIDGGQQLVAG